MNINTGEIKEFDEKSNLLEKLTKEWIEIQKKDMTKKQKKEMKVSLKDHKSKLGKKLTKTKKGS